MITNHLRRTTKDVTRMTLQARRGYHQTISRLDDKNNNAAKDTRLAGRVRFYKQVGVQAVDAPWESKKLVDAIDSPISAGVDGTQSASGVGNTLPSDTLMLRPRKPRTNEFGSNNGGWFGITLDGRVVKTPLGQTLAVPSEMLAWAIAAEWDAQEKNLLPAQMPLMTLSCTALDQTASAPHISQTIALGYLPTDTICYYADPAEDRVLYRRQEQAWNNIHGHCKELFGAMPAMALGASEGLLMSRVRKQKSIGLPHPEEISKGAAEFVESLDAWHLTAFTSVVAESKSFLVGLALLSQLASPTEAINAARAEEEFQIDNWGLVEGGHDYDRLNCSIQIHSAQMLISSIALDNEFK